MSVHYTYERVVENYNGMVEERVDQCIIEYRQKPIGFCQFCVLNAQYFEVPREKYDVYVKPGELAYGIDIFLGEVSMRDKGLGAQILSLLVKAFFEDYRAGVVMIDPKTHNTRAIRCYEKAGFQPYFVVPQREALDDICYDSLIMGIQKP